MLDLAILFSWERLLLGLCLAAIIALGARRLGALTPSGAIAAALVGGLTYGLGGLPAAIILIAFFGSSSLLSKTSTKRKRKVAADFAKGGRRDWAQVAANGGVPVLALLAGAGGLLAAPVAWVVFAAALATVSADTWATELGVLSKIPPRLITTGKSVTPGTSGGVSLLGNLVGLGAAFFIGILAWLVPGSVTIQVVLIATAAGTPKAIWPPALLVPAIKIAASTPLNETIASTERSMPPVRMTKVCPAATMPIAAASSPSSIQLLGF